MGEKMDFSPEILQFQGTIILANNLNPFSKLAYRGGNENNISNIVNLLKNHLKSKNYLTHDGLSSEFKDILRYFNYYIVLNSDLQYLEELVDSPDLGHLIWTTPTITECLLCELIWGLNFEIFAAEIISYANPHLSLNLLKSLISSLRHVACNDYYKKLEILLQSAYESVVRLHFYDCNEDIKTLLMSDYLDAFHQGLGYYITPPTKCGTYNLINDDLYKFYANIMKSLLRLLIRCFEMFLKTPKSAVDESHKIYICTLSDSLKHQEIQFRVCDSKETPLLKNILLINEILLDCCMTHAMLISVDAFCCWSEYEDAKGQTLQRSVGELAHQACSHMNSHPLLKHELANVLCTIACEPQSLKDAISVATNESLIENGSKVHAEQTLWLQAIASKEGLFDNEQLIECLLENLEKLRTEDSAILLTKTIGYAKQNAYEISDVIKTLVVKSLIKSERDRWNDLLANKIFTNNKFTNILQLPDFEKNLTETFNKIHTKNVDIAKVYNVFVQNPKETYRKVLQVGIHDAGQTDAMIHLLECFNHFTKHHYLGDDLQTILLTVSDSFEFEFTRDVEKECFLKIIRSICLNDVTVTNDVLFEILIIKIQEYSSAKLYNKLELGLSILETLFSTYNNYSVRAPLLCFLSRIMDDLRWNPKTFIRDRSRALSTAIDLQQQIIGTYNYNIPDKDAHWLKANCKNMHRLNRFYYTTLWNMDGIDFLRYAMGDNIDFDNINNLLDFSRNLTSCTLKEWKAMASALEHSIKGDHIDILLKALFIIAVAVRDNNTSNTAGFLKSCFRQFAGILQEACTTPDNDSTTIDKRLHLLLRLLATALSQENACDFALMFLQTCSHISSSISQPLDAKVVEYLNVIGNSQLKQIFNVETKTDNLVNGA